MKLRLFLAISPPADVAAEADRIQQDAKRLLQFRGIRWVPLENRHLTLRFLGDLPADELEPLIGRLLTARVPAPFTLTLSGPGVFPSPRQPRVLWLGVTGDLGALGCLATGIGDAVDPFLTQKDARPFSPHLTLGRIKERFPAQFRGSLANWMETPGGSSPWHVSAFELWQSTLMPSGAHYELLRRFPLKQGLEVEDRP